MLSLIAALPMLNAENAVFEAPGDIRLEGRESATQYAMAWLNAFPDARITVNNQLVAGDWAVQEITFEGTHEATLSGPRSEEHTSELQSLMRISYAVFSFK